MKQTQYNSFKFGDWLSGASIWTTTTVFLLQEIRGWMSRLRRNLFKKLHFALKLWIIECHLHINNMHFKTDDLSKGIQIQLEDQNRIREVRENLLQVWSNDYDSKINRSSSTMRESIQLYYVYETALSCLATFLCF